MDPAALRSLGWDATFERQLTPAERAACEPLRVCSVQRTNLEALAGIEPVTVQFPRAARWSEQVTVGDWILATSQHGQRYLERVLERRNGLLRRAAGEQLAGQWIAANLDVAFVVMACDRGFNPNRLERFLTVALAGGVDPVVLLTKADLCDDPADRVRAITVDSPVHALDARNPAEVQVLRPYAEPGHTLAFIGPSGAGKSTLINTLAGERLMPTAPVRADGKGRHTTTRRQLLILPGGALVIDTPGMRELGLAAADPGLDRLFDDIERLARQCRFRDCSHRSEPGCAVQAALAEGRLERRRWENYRKMRDEQAALERPVLEAGRAGGGRPRAAAPAKPRRYDGRLDD